MDTLKHYDRLRAAGVPDEQARAQVEWEKCADAKFAALRADIRGDFRVLKISAAAFALALMFFEG